MARHSGFISFHFPEDTLHTTCGGIGQPPNIVPVKDGKNYVILGSGTFGAVYLAQFEQVKNSQKDLALLLK